MAIQQLLTRPCTITRRTASNATDDYGNVTRVTTTVETVCELQQRERSEPGDQGEFSDTSWLLILPAGTAIDTGDQVTVDSRGYELVGDPWPARNPLTGAESHIEATVRRTAGEDET